MRTMLIIAERYGLMRDGLAALLSDAAPTDREGDGQGARVVRSAGSMAEVMALLPLGQDGVLLLDLGLLDGPGGVAAGLREVRSRFPAWPIIALAERDTRDGVLECLAAGAHGYVAKTAAAGELLRAVAVVQQGGVHVPAVLATADPVPTRGAVATPDAAPVCHLTGRQRDVLRLMAEGRSTKDIARTLDLAVSTIKVHLAAVYRTVGARNRVEALCRAGLLPSGPMLS